MDANQAQVDLANQKLAKLIDILKTIATEQAKMDQVLQGQGEIKTLVSQGGVDQVLQGQGEVLNTQQEMKEALADLRRKANVNISRNDDILKQIRKKNKSARPAP